MTTARVAWWWAPLVSALTVAALLLAGPGQGVNPQANGTTASRTETATRLVCPGGGPAGTVRIADLAGAGGEVRVDRAEAALEAGKVISADAGRRPTQVRASGALADGVHATVVGGGAAVNCSQPRAVWWFGGAGATANHRSRLVLVNPRSGIATADVQVLGPDGPVQAPDLRGIAVPAGEAAEFDLSRVAPGAGDLTVRVRANRGLVVAGLVDRAAPGPDARPEWIPAQRSPERKVVVPAVPMGPGRPTLQITNPGETAVVAQIRVGGRKGRFQPEDLPEQRIPPATTRTFDLPRSVSREQSSVAVSADAPVLVTTAARNGLGRGDSAYGVGGVELSGRAGIAVGPEGSRSLVLSAVEAAATAKVVFTSADGRERARRIEVDDQATVRVPFPPRAVSVIVDSTGGLVGAVTLDLEGGRSVLPLAAPGLRPGAIGVRPGPGPGPSRG